MNSLICPISTNRVNKPVVRTTGFLVATSIVLYVLTSNILILFALSIDFYIRAYTDLKFSPLSFLASKITKLFKFKKFLIDKAPKVFAARVGLLFTLTAIGLSFVNPTLPIIVSLILMSFALLESVMNFCVGCVVYTYLVLPFYKKSHA